MDALTPMKAVRPSCASIVADQQVRMNEPVWKELIRRRQSVERDFLHPAVRPDYADPGVSQDDVQDDAMGTGCYFASCAADDQIRVTKPEDVQALTEPVVDQASMDCGKWPKPSP